jgi:DNA-directed RNA polymerase subunit M/transcription elongation factor TFIIS
MNVNKYTRFLNVRNRTKPVKYLVTPAALPYVSKCPRCLNNTLVVEMIQKRAADEEATQHRRCVACGYTHI